MRDGGQMLEHALERLGEHLELVARETLDEVAADLANVLWCGAAEAVQSGPGEHSERSPPVLRAQRPLDETLAGEAVDPTCQSARGEQHPVGQLAHPESMVRCFGEGDEHPIVGDADLLGRLELGVEQT